MGYCYTTGRKEKGKWIFLRVDGRRNICAVDHAYLPEGERCRQCIEYCKTYAEAVRAIEEWERIHAEIEKEYEKKEVKI